MSKDVLKIFVVDDDPLARMIVVQVLDCPQAKVDEFDSGEACLAMLGERPDIVILDVEMPGVDGIAVCRQLRAGGNEEAQVIFVSAHDDLDTRLSAYDAGGNDYIVKPCNPEEFRRKIDAARRELKARREADSQTDLARQAAFSAMSSLGELGVQMDFLRASFVCQTVDELGIALCNAIAQYELHGMVELRDGDKRQCYSTAGASTALEVAILGHVRDMGRIFQFSDRLAINYPMTTLLISNLPVTDPEFVGRLRDHLVVLAEGAEARFQVIVTETKRHEQAQRLLGIAGDLGRALDEVENHQQAHRVQAMAIANEQLDALTRAFVHLGLTERQEETLVALAQEGIDRTARLQDYSIDMSRQLSGIAAQLKAVAGG